jgi:pyridoxine 5-phosphate synthase
MRLYVNVDHVATVREARGTDEPDPVHAAFSAELGGADGITVHLREDRRHISDRDVRLLVETVRTCVNLELAAAEDMVSVACELKPTQATLVPERREELTTEGGLNLGSAETRRSLEGAIGRLREAEIRVSLFVDPTSASLEISKSLGAEAVELHTGEYANATRAARREVELGRILMASQAAHDLGLSVHAGHGLTYVNITPVAALPLIEEVNIGHSIVARAITCGMTAAVAEMRRLILEAPSRMREPGRWVSPIGY